MHVCMLADFLCLHASHIFITKFIYVYAICLRVRSAYCMHAIMRFSLCLCLFTGGHCATCMCCTKSPPEPWAPATWIMQVHVTTLNPLARITSKPVINFMQHISANDKFTRLKSCFLLLWTGECAALRGPIQQWLDLAWLVFLSPCHA